jgi:hypothetical protein
MSNRNLGPQWSGPDPGQLVMGVHDAAHGNPTTLGDYTPHEPFEVDRHGFVYEKTALQGGRTKPSADKAAGNQSARDLYRKWGGGRDTDPKVVEHWQSQPLHEVRSDTVIHTSQDYDTTEHKATPTKAPGRERIEGIRQHLASGGETDPAWLVRQSGRLYAMDGHHRIVGHREAGKEFFKAHVWDRDAR